MEHAIFQPVLALVALTAVVWLYMYILRLRYLTAQNIDAQELASPRQVAELIPAEVNNPASNLANLTEVPVLFYVVCIVAALVGAADATMLTCAWVYVGLRAVHSLIQCTINKVMARFLVYALSCLVLWYMLIDLMLAVF